MAPTPTIKTLTRRADFLRVAEGGVNTPTPGLVLQAAPNRDGGDDIFLGFTVSGKVGNAVVRNRVKRRLREVAKDVLPASGRAGVSYVMIGRRAALKRPFAGLKQDLQQALDVLHRKIK